MTELNGGCLCSQIRYHSTETTRPATLCHCRSCRRASGSHVLGFVWVSLRGFRFTAGRPTEYRSSPPVVRTFCPRCGTPLTYWYEGDPNEISLTIGSLDRPDLVPPVDHTWMSDAVGWDTSTDGLPRFPTDRAA